MKKTIKISLVLILILIFSNQYHKNTFNSILDKQNYNEEKRFTNLDGISSKKKDKVFFWGLTKEKTMEGLTEENQEILEEIFDTYQETCDNELLKIKINDVIYDVSLDEHGFEEKLRLLVKKHQVNLLFYDYYENIFLEGIIYKGERNNPLVNFQKNYFELTSEPRFNMFPATKELLTVKKETIYYEEKKHFISFFNQEEKKQEMFKLKRDEKGFFEHFIKSVKRAKEEIFSTDEIDSFDFEGNLIKLKRIPYKWYFQLEWGNGEENDAYNKIHLGEKNARLTNNIFRIYSSYGDEINSLIKNELSHTPNKGELKRFSNVTVVYEYVAVELFNNDDYIIIKDNATKKIKTGFYIAGELGGLKKDALQKRFNRHGMKNGHDFGYGSSMDKKEIKLKELFVWTKKIPKLWGEIYYAVPIYGI